MNVIVSNRQKEIIDNANIDAIKDLNGLFNVNDLINKFKNYFFSKMILDATSIVDFASRDVLTTLANEIGSEKLIILLPSSPEPPLEFKKLLIELKIYNFTTDINEVIKFIEKSNTYEDAIKLIDGSFSNDIYVDNSIKEQDNISEEDVNNEVEMATPISTSGQSSLGDILSNLSLGNSVTESNIDQNIYSSSDEEEPHDEMGKSINEQIVLDNNQQINEVSVENNFVNTDIPTGDNKNVFLLPDDFNGIQSDIPKQENVKKVIGIKNVTTHAGSTSLIYMLHKMATVNMKKNVLSIEVDKNDFRLFRDKKMISVGEKELKKLIDDSDNEVIFIDLNGSDGNDICSDILYLVEPSTIKLNELMASNRSIFKELRGKKVLLNKSLLSSNDIKILESEAGLEFFLSIGPLNDRITNDAIIKLLGMLDIK